VAREIVARNGYRGLFQGYTSVALRDSPFMIILFSSYESMKQRFDHRYLLILLFVSAIN
jgi:hypothetical protein